ncbi:MAG: PKD domain-containing protein, partial [Candidatus Aenigmarchaeota archaeon]|nr:PKD domain-containing protein [Candidatus Aenigmarchaeota archaeon]
VNYFRNVFSRTVGGVQQLTTGRCGKDGNNRDIESCVIITADNKYYFYLNGRKITDEKSDWKTADRYPVTLINGENLIAVWSKDSGGDEGVLVEVWHKGRLVVKSDSAWKSLHANKGPDGWDDLAYDDSNWALSRNTRERDDRAEAKLNGQEAFSEAEWMWCSNTNDDEECRYRKAFNVNPNANVDPQTIVNSGNYIRITADDTYSLAINDVNIGECRNWKKGYVYAYTLQPGDVIGILAKDDGGDVGLLFEAYVDGALRFSSDNTWRVKKVTSLSNDERNNWRKKNAGFNDQSWEIVRENEQKDSGDRPIGFTQAQWIWSEDTTYDIDFYAFRKVVDVQILEGSATSSLDSSQGSGQDCEERGNLGLYSGIPGVSPIELARDSCGADANCRWNLTTSKCEAKPQADLSGQTDPILINGQLPSAQPITINTGERVSVSISGGGGGPYQASVLKETSTGNCKIEESQIADVNEGFGNVPSTMNIRGISGGLCRFDVKSTTTNEIIEILVNVAGATIDDSSAIFIRADNGAINIGEVATLTASSRTVTSFRWGILKENGVTDQDCFIVYGPTQNIGEGPVVKDSVLIRGAREGTCTVAVQDTDSTDPKRYVATYVIQVTTPPAGLSVDVSSTVNIGSRVTPVISGGTPTYRVGLLPGVTACRIVFPIPNAGGTAFVNANTFIVEGLAAGSCVVRVQDNADPSQIKDVSIIVQEAIPPEPEADGAGEEEGAAITLSPPTGLTATLSGTNVVLNWNTGPTSSAGRTISVSSDKSSVVVGGQAAEIRASSSTVSNFRWGILGTNPACYIVYGSTGNAGSGPVVANYVLVKGTREGTCTVAVQDTDSTDPQKEVVTYVLSVGTSSGATGAVVYSNEITGNAAAFDSIINFFKRLFGIGVRAGVSGETRQVVYDIWRNDGIIANGISCATRLCSYTDRNVPAGTYTYKVGARFSGDDTSVSLGNAISTTITVPAEEPPRPTGCASYGAEQPCVTGGNSCYWDTGVIPNSCKDKKTNRVACTADTECTSGYCQPGTNRVCANRPTECNSLSNCPEDRCYVVGSTCQVKKDNDVACASSNECKSNNCVNSLCKASGVGAAEANRVPVPNIQFPIAGGRYPLGAIEFDATGSSDADSDSLTYTWTVRDATGRAVSGSLTGIKVAYQFTARGTYTAELSVTDTKAVRTRTVTFDIYNPAENPPTAVIVSSASGGNVYSGTSVKFDSNSHDAGAGTITRQTWDLSDSVRVIRTVQGTNFTHTFANVGTYKVKLTVVDNDGNTDTEEIQLNVVNRDAGIPRPSITVAGTARAGETLTFTGVATDTRNDINTFKWEIDDVVVETGSCSTGVYCQDVLQKSDLAVGRHTVKFKVRDALNPEQSATKIVDIVDSAAPRISFVKPMGIINHRVEFIEGTNVEFEVSATDDGTISRYQWADGATVLSTDLRFSTATLTRGSHRITITVTDNTGKSTSDYVDVTIREQGAPMARIVSPTNGASYREGETIPFRAEKTGGNIVEWLWVDRYGGQAQGEPQMTVLGDRAEFTRNDLGVGLHTIELFVKDEETARHSIGTYNIIITVDVPNAPVINVASPVRDRSYDTNKIEFRAEITDNVRVETVEWAVEEIGIIGNNNSFASTLPRG